MILNKEMSMTEQEHRRPHQRVVHPSDCDCGPICRGGLFECAVCGQAEAELEPSCPGPKQPEIEEHKA